MKPYIRPTKVHQEGGAKFWI